MSFCAPLGAFAGDFTQHSTIFLHFVSLMSPLRHHPLILCPQLPTVVFLFSSRERSWSNPSYCSSCVHLLSFVFHIIQSSMCQQCGLYVILCPSWCVCRGFHSTFHYFFTFRVFDVSSPPSSLDFVSPAAHCGILIFIEGEKLVKPFLLQLMCPFVVLCFSYYPIVHELRLSWSSMESHKYTVFESRVPHQHSSLLESEGKKLVPSLPVVHVFYRVAMLV
jgi:hypothetical protein